MFHHIGKGRGPAVAGTPGDNLVRLDDVNNMSSEEFVRTFSGLFQGPDWMVERAYAQRPFTDTQDLRRSFQEALFAATPEEQEQLISSYPDLGAVSVAVGEEGEDSQSDQSVLGLTRLAEQEHQELAALTKAYRDRFGFTLIMAVRDHENIDQLLRQRLGAAEQLADPGARGRADRDREDRHAPVRPAGGRREPDPVRPHPAPRHSREEPA